jgi:hypothetical protein
VTLSVTGISAAVPNHSFPLALANSSKYGPGTAVDEGVGVAVGVAVAVTTQAHADTTLEGEPPQFEANVGRAAPAEGVNVGQKAAAADEALINWRRQLSWLQPRSKTAGDARAGWRRVKATAAAAKDEEYIIFAKLDEIGSRDGIADADLALFSQLQTQEHGCYIESRVLLHLHLHLFSSPPMGRAYSIQPEKKYPPPAGTGSKVLEITWELDHPT